IKVWYDEFELKLGDSLRRSIDKGLINSKYGIVVLSTSFFKRNWTQYELDGFVNREMNGMKVILPIWHKVSKDEVQKFSPSLADKVALNSSVYSIKEIAEEINTLLKQ
ncbi:MAG: toll/interleukin-1 receptor domain-containing protein, partial [Maribacter sp.]